MLSQGKEYSLQSSSGGAARPNSYCLQGIHLPGLLYQEVPEVSSTTGLSLQYLIIYKVASIKPFAPSLKFRVLLHISLRHDQLFELLLIISPA